MMGLPCFGGATGNWEGTVFMGAVVGQPSHSIETHLPQEDEGDFILVFLGRNKRWVSIK